MRDKHSRARQGRDPRKEEPHAAEPTSLTLEEIPYRITVSREYFLQWVTLKNRIIGFPRLSLPDQKTVHTHANELPVLPGEAMIREVHVYDRVASLHGQGQNAQHDSKGKTKRMIN